MKKSERQTYFLAMVSAQLSGNTEGRMSPERGSQLSLFIRLREYPSPACRCQAVRKRIMSWKFNVKTYNALRAAPESRKTQDLGHSVLGWLERAFVIIGLRCNHPSGAIV